MTLSALSILLTAPLAAVLIPLVAPYLLKQDPVFIQVESVDVNHEAENIDESEEKDSKNHRHHPKHRQHNREGIKKLDRIIRIGPEDYHEEEVEATDQKPSAQETAL